MGKLPSFEEVESGKWKVENGKWKVKSGKWKVESGKWRVENGEWKGVFHYCLIQKEKFNKKCF
jgi:hypothetical protein